MKDILLVIDIQNGFTAKNHTATMVDKISKLLKSDIFDYVIGTRFINNTDSMYDKLMNWNKMIHGKETEIPNSIAIHLNEVIDKNVYSCVNSSLIQKLLHANGGTLPSHVYLLGIDTDCCVLASSIDFFEMGIRPIVLSKYSYSNGGESSHQAGLLVMKRLIGINQILNKDINSKNDLIF